MSALLLYLATTVALIALWRRYVQPISRGAAIALLLLPLCFTGRALLTGKIYAPADLPFMAEPLKDYAKEYGTDVVHNGTLSDLYMQIMPWRQAVRYAMSHGEWPLWNPFILSGDILAQAAQPAPYDPFNLLSMSVRIESALTYTAAITFFLAGFFTFAFARSLGLREVSSLIASAGFMFHGVLAFFVGWPLARAWAFFPFVLYATRRLIVERTAFATGLLTLAFVLVIFSGHPESILHIVATGAAYGAFEWWRQRSARGLVLAVVAGVLALALTAIFLLPFLDATSETVERHMRMELFAKSNFEAAPELVAKRAGVAFFPWFGGGPENDNFTPLWDPLAARTGGLILALAVAALFVVRRRETWFFFALALIGLCAAFDAPPVAHLLHELPGFDMALNERLAFAAAFALSILAAFAIDGWTKRGAFALAGVALVLTAGTLLLRPSQLALGVRPELILKLALIDILPIALVAFLRVPAAAPLILGLVLMQRTFEDGAMYPSLPREVFYPKVPVIEAIPKSSEPFRVVGMHFALIPGTSTFYGLEDVRGYQAMTFNRIAQTYPLWAIPQPVSFNAVADVRSPLLSMLNVRYALSPGEPNPPDGWTAIHTDRETTLFENTRVLPRVFIPRRVQYEQHDRDVLSRMKNATDYGELSYILAPNVGPHEIANGPGEIKLLRNDGLAYDMNLTMHGEGWVIVSASAWKGWRAYVDGRRVNTHYANHAWLGVYVQQGFHHVKFVYLPASFTTGRTISFGTAALLTLWALWRRRARRRTPPTPSPE